MSYEKPGMLVALIEYDEIVKLENEVFNLVQSLSVNASDEDLISFSRKLLELRNSYQTLKVVFEQKYGDVGLTIVQLYETLS